MRFLLPIFLFFHLFLGAQTVKLPYTEGYIPAGDGVQIFYRILGESPDTVVVIPGGNGFGSYYLMADLRPLAAHHTLLFMDQAGAGYSTPVTDTARLGMGRYVADMEVFRKYFHLQKMTLLGHSTGGLICGAYAAAHADRVQRMILIDPIPSAARWMAGYDSNKKLDSIAALILQRNYQQYGDHPQDSVKACWDFYALWARGQFPTPVHARRTWGDVCNCLQTNLLSPIRYYVFRSMGNWDLSKSLSRVKAPVLIFGGEEDEIPMGSFEHWKGSLPDSRLVVVKNSAHMPHVDNPVLFFGAVEQFLQGKWPDPVAPESGSAGIVLPGDHAGTPYQQARAELIGIENRLVRWANLVQWDSLASVYAPDATIYPPGAPPVHGRKAIASFWHTASIRGMHTLELQLMDVEESGEKRIANGKYVMYDQAGGFLDIGKFIAIYQKTKAGWQLSTDIFNSGLETRSPLEVPDYLKWPGN